MKPLEITEINGYAADIASSVKAQLDDAWYEGSGISLSINFSTESELGAWASVWPTLEKPLRHEISITYSLVQRLYNEAFDFSMFAFNPDGKSLPLETHLIPAEFDFETAVNFMFESAIAFLIFHELAHLNQSHGDIRARYGKAGDTPQRIAEFTKVKDDALIVGDLASAYHATELAADFEALDWMFTSLGAMFKGDDLVDHAYLQCSIVSCIMLIFNGDKPAHLDDTPSKSHPYPWPRMETWVQTYVERLELSSNFFAINLSRAAITKRLMDASYVAILKWMTRFEIPETPEYVEFVKGARNHPNYRSYMQQVIKLWSQEYKAARGSRKYGPPFSVLYFTDEFRNMVGASLNDEPWKEHIEKSFT